MRVLVLALARLAFAATASADNEVSLGVATGGHVFARDLELGVADAPGQGSPATGVLVGARLGVRVLTFASVEGELVLIPTTERMSGESIDVLGYRAQAAVDVARNGPVRAFLVAGAGVLDLLAGGVPTMEDDTDLALHWGGGVAVAVSPHLEVRVDGRHLVLPSIRDSGAASDVEVTAGLAYLVGIEP
jgi:opacity protein-like surface antigen